MELFDEMVEKGVDIDAVSVNTAIAAAEAVGDDARAAELREGAPFKGEDENALRMLAEQNKEVERENTAYELRVRDMEARIAEAEAEHAKAAETAREREAEVAARAEHYKHEVSTAQLEIGTVQRRVEGVQEDHLSRLAEVEAGHKAQVREMVTKHAEAVRQVEEEHDKEHEVLPPPAHSRALSSSPSPPPAQLPYAPHP